MPTARPMIPSSDRLVSNTRASPNRFCSPSVTRCTPPFRPTSSPKTSDLRVHLELARQRAAHRLGEAHRRRPRPPASSVAAERVALSRAARPPNASRRRRAASPRSTNRFTVAGSGRGRARAAASAGVDVARDLRLERRPLGLAHQRRHEVRAQPRQRIARLVGRDLRVGAIALLVVRPRVAATAAAR